MNNEINKFNENNDAAITHGDIVQDSTNATENSASVSFAANEKDIAVKNNEAGGRDFVVVESTAADAALINSVLTPSDICRTYVVESTAANDSLINEILSPVPEENNHISEPDVSVAYTQNVTAEPETEVSTEPVVNVAYTQNVTAEPETEVSTEPVVSVAYTQNTEAITEQKNATDVNMPKNEESVDPQAASQAGNESSQQQVFKPDKFSAPTSVAAYTMQNGLFENKNDEEESLYSYYDYSDIDSTKSSGRGKKKKKREISSDRIIMTAFFVIGMILLFILLMKKM